MKASLTLLAAFLFNVWMVTSAGAQAWTVPYQGIADSPFHEFGIEGTLRAEDFEGGSLNLPGVELMEMTEPSAGYTFVTGTIPRSSANSIAEDTGDPTTGLFLLNDPALCSTTFPPRCSSIVSLKFSEETLGQLPTFVGFAWTDAVRFDDPSFPRAFPTGRVSTFNAEGQLLDVLEVRDLPLRDASDPTSDDMFFAFVHHDGFSRLDFKVITDEEGGLLSMDHLQVGLAALAGDADRDGTVDFADFLKLSANFGEPGNWQAGDFNFDGYTTFRDFLLLANNFGRALNRVDVLASAVPEPATSLLGLAAVLGLAHISRQRRKQTDSSP